VGSSFARRRRGDLEPLRKRFCPPEGLGARHLSYRKKGSERDGQLLRTRVGEATRGHRAYGLVAKTRGAADGWTAHAAASKGNQHRRETGGRVAIGGCGGRWVELRLQERTERVGQRGKGEGTGCARGKRGACRSVLGISRNRGRVRRAGTEDGAWTRGKAPKKGLAVLRNSDARGAARGARIVEALHLGTRRGPGGKKL